VLAAVLGDVAGDFGRFLRADGLDVGRVRALAMDCQFAVEDRGRMSERSLLDGSEQACGRSRDSDASGNGQDGEDGGGLCEHGVDFVVV